MIGRKFGFNCSKIKNSIILSKEPGFFCKLGFVEKLQVDIVSKIPRGVVN